VSTDTLKDLQTALGDRYRVEREIGHGGMATVYLAEDIKHGRMVAVKVLHPELAVAVGPARFRREIAIVARLQHPHILPLLDSGESAGGPLWFVMPYVDGETLRDRLAREHQLTLADALGITREIASALDFAHRQGVIHRDIKPANILLAAGGRALLADFGVARDVIAFGEASGARRLTDTGLSVGTLEYMSPEQASGRTDVDARTDIYSLGCVLYEMLAGEPPFTGATPQALVARRLVERPLPLRAVRDRIPVSVEQAVDTALARSPADRYQTAGDFAAALDVPSAGGTSRPDWRSSPGVDTVRAPWRRRVVVATLVAIGLTGTAFGLRTWLQRPRPTTPIVTLAVLPFDNLGDSTASYFTDGVTDEIRGRLAALPELQVVARASSAFYRHSAKPLQQIAAELGVRYLLSGQVRWERVSGRTRVRVDPELVDVSDGSAPRVKWEQPFDIDVSDVLEVQAAVATDVATALNVTLGASQAQLLASRPTSSVPAYRAFLEGEAATASVTAVDAPSLHRGIDFYTQAVTTDPSFGIAWAELSATQSSLYNEGSPTPDNAQAALYALQRAQALDSNGRETLHAAAEYEAYVDHDYARVRVVDSAALARYPNDVSFLTAVAADEQDQGRFEAALARLQHARVINPRANRRALAHCLLYLHRYAEADATLDEQLAQFPTDLASIEAKAIVALGRGDLLGARAVLNSGVKVVGDTTAVLAQFANFYALYWVPDSIQQQQLLALPASALDNDHGQWGLLRAQMYWLHGDTTHARAWADTARRIFAAQLQVSPTSPILHVNYGEALGYLGQRAAAIEQVQRATAMVPVSANAYTGPFFQEMAARVYTFVGDTGQAIARLEDLVRHPYILTPAWLRIDPTWRPLRNHPRFEQLVRRE